MANLSSLNVFCTSNLGLTSTVWRCVPGGPSTTCVTVSGVKCLKVSPRLKSNFSTEVCPLRWPLPWMAGTCPSSSLTAICSRRCR